MKYYFGLDVLRAGMMLLGLLIHAVYFMNITETYHPSPSLEVFSNFFKLFRMECFFILSGFLSAMLITRKGKEYLIDNRIKRVVIPLLSSLIVASALINYFYEPVVFFNGSIGYHIQHLWFLITLAILSFISISNVFNNFHNYSLSFFKKIVFLFVLYLFFRFLELSLRGVVSRNLFDIYVFFILKTTYFFIFYYIGFVFYRNENILNHVINNRGIYGALAIFFALISSYIFYINGVNGIKLNFIYLIIRNISDFGAAICISFLFFGFFYTINYQNNFIKFLVDSSLVIYVFHFPVLKVLNGIFRDYNFPNSTLYLVFLISLTFLITVLVYFLLKKNSFTRKMFGYK